LPAISASGDTPTLYGTDVYGSSTGFSSVNTSTGAYTGIGPIGFLKTTGLAFDPNTQTMYGVTNYDELLTINTSTGAGTLVGPVGLNVDGAGLAFDPGASKLYMTDYGNDRLYTLNTSTGAATLIGPTVIPNISSLAFDPTTTTLYGVSSTQDSLFTLNTTTGLASPVAAAWWGLGVAYNDGGLAFDVASNTLFMSTNWTNAPDLFTVNTATGVATSVGPTGVGYDAALAFAYPSAVPVPGAAVLGMIGIGMVGAYTGLSHVGFIR